MYFSIAGKKEILYNMQSKTILQNEIGDTG